MVRTGQRFGAGQLIDVLRGRDTERVRKFGHQRLSTFGIGSDFDDSQWRSVTRQLLANGQLTPDPDGFGGLRIGPGAAAVLRGESAVVLRKDPLVGRGSGRDPRRPAARVAMTDLSTADEELFQRLRALRSAMAKEQALPPYVIFHDKTLREMAVTRPVDLPAMANISGVGAAKLERYGEAFLAVIAGN